jgi:hypothetical protein
MDLSVAGAMSTEGFEKAIAAASAGTSVLVYSAFRGGHEQHAAANEAEWRSSAQDAANKTFMERTLMGDESSLAAAIAAGKAAAATLEHIIGTQTSEMQKQDVHCAVTGAMHGILRRQFRDREENALANSKEAARLAKLTEACLRALFYWRPAPTL